MSMENLIKLAAEANAAGMTYGQYMTSRSYTPPKKRKLPYDGPPKYCAECGKLMEFKNARKYCMECREEFRKRGLYHG